MTKPHELLPKYGALIWGLPVGLTGGVLWWREVHGVGDEGSLKFFIVMLIWAVSGCIWGMVFGRIWKWVFPKAGE